MSWQTYCCAMTATRLTHSKALHWIIARAIAAALLTLALAVVSGCLDRNPIRAWEYRQIVRRFESLGNAHVILLGGTHDIDVQGAFAEISLGDQKRLLLTGLTVRAFDGTRPFAIQCAGGWGVEINRVHRRGAPYQLQVGGTDDDAIRLFGFRIETVTSAISQYSRIVAALEKLPLFPDKLRVLEPSGLVSAYSRTPCKLHDLAERSFVIGSPKLR
jgi:hypothetical protein